MILKTTSKYRKGLKHLTRSGKINVVKNLQQILDDLEAGKQIDQKFNNHELKGNLKGVFDCHPDPSGQWILVYGFLDNNTIILYCLGPHNKCIDDFGSTIF